MEADLYNIVPVVAELEADRSNFLYGDVAKEERLYGACDIEVDRAHRIVEPPQDVRGDIARIYLYMRDVYGDELPLTPAEIANYEQWNDEDPPSAWEVERNRRIAAIQGRANDHLPITLSTADEPNDKPDRGEGEGEGAPAPDETAGAPKTAP
jgi:deoxyribonuclease-1